MDKIKETKYHKTHGVTRHIAGEKYSHSCPDCGANSLKGNLDLAFPCTAEKYKKDVRVKNADDPTCLVNFAVFGFEGVLGTAQDTVPWIRSSGLFPVFKSMVESGDFCVEIWSVDGTLESEISAILENNKVDPELLAIRAAKENRTKEWLESLPVTPTFGCFSDRRVVTAFEKAGITLLANYW